MKRTLLCLLVFSACLSPALADNAALQRCRDLRDPAARLVCYDAIPLAAPSATDTTAPAAAAAPSLAPPPGAATFGLESRRPPPAAPAPLEAIDSSIDGPFEGWLPSGRFALANGQVWEVADGSQAAYNLKSPKVRITRGVASTFFMAIEGVAQTPRVRRIR